MILTHLTLTPQLSADLAACHSGAWSLTVTPTRDGGVSVRRSCSGGVSCDVGPEERTRVLAVVARHRAGEVSR